jgi:hypothetical protein
VITNSKCKTYQFHHMQSTYLDTNGLSITCGMETLLLANVTD